MNLKKTALAALLIGGLVLAGCGSSSNVILPEEVAQSPTLPADTVAALDSLLDRNVHTLDLPSALLYVHIPGQGDYLATRGVSNLATGAPRNINSPFRIASVTKTFIATGILILADRGQLNTSDPLSKWYPDFPNAANITVEDLLEMRSGIPDATDPPFMENYFADPLLDLSEEDMIALSASRPGEFTSPGEVTRYRNVNFILLERILTKVSGQTTQEFLQQNIFAPLGMTSTVYPTTPDLPGDLRGYSLEPSTGVFLDKTILNPVPAGGAGAIISTLADLQVYAEALGQGRLLRPSTQSERLLSFPFEGAPDFVRYGEGMEVLGDWIGHNGTIFGFSTEMYYLPEAQATIIVNVNRLDLDDQSKSTPIFLEASGLLFPDASPWSP